MEYAKCVPGASACTGCAPFAPLLTPPPPLLACAQVQGAPHWHRPGGVGLPSPLPVQQTSPHPFCPLAAHSRQPSLLLHAGAAASGRLAPQGGAAALFFTYILRFCARQEDAVANVFHGGLQPEGHPPRGARSRALQPYSSCTWRTGCKSGWRARKLRTRGEQAWVRARTARRAAWATAAAVRRLLRALLGCGTGSGSAGGGSARGGGVGEARVADVSGEGWGAALGPHACRPGARSTGRDKWEGVDG